MRRPKSRLWSSANNGKAFTVRGHEKLFILIAMENHFLLFAVNDDCA
jgi:hypothetical protein